MWVRYVRDSASEKDSEFNFASRELRVHTSEEKFCGSINRSTIADQVNNNAIYPEGAL